MRGAIGFAIDVLLLVALLLLLSPRLTGLPVHEWLGVALGLAVIAHLFLSWSWIRRATQQLVAGSRWRSRFNFALNWILLILVVTEIASGIAISAVALPFLGISTVNDRTCVLSTT